MLSARSEVMCRQFDTITIARMLVGRAVFDALAAIPFFAGLERDALERLAGSMRSRRFRRGEVIFHLGDPGDALFVIVSGDVKISLPSETGEEAILATLGSGAVFGELVAALLDPAAHGVHADAQQVRGLGLGKWVHNAGGLMLMKAGRSWWVLTSTGFG